MLRSASSEPSSRRTPAPFALIVSVLALVSGTAFAADDPEVQLEKVELPAGFSIDVFASGVDVARSLAQSPSGTVFVGTGRRGGGIVHASVGGLPDPEVLAKPTRLSATLAN